MLPSRILAVRKSKMVPFQLNCPANTEWGLTKCLQNLGLGGATPWWGLLGPCHPVHGAGGRVCLPGDSGIPGCAPAQRVQRAGRNRPWPHVWGSHAGLGLTCSWRTHTHTHTPGCPLPVEGLLAQGDGRVGGPFCRGGRGLSEAGCGQDTAEAVSHL